MALGTLVPESQSGILPSHSCQTEEEEEVESCLLGAFGVMSRRRDGGWRCEEKGKH